MKSTSVLFVVLVSVCLCGAQNAPARTDVYMVHFAYAAPGKAAQVADFLETPIPKILCRDTCWCCAIKMARSGTSYRSPISAPKLPWRPAE